MTKQAESNSATGTSLLTMLRFEWRIGSRTTAWRVLAGLFFLYGCSLGHVEGHGAGSVAYATGQAGWEFGSLLAIFWISLIAVRETAQRTRVLTLVKPQTGEKLALVRYLGGFAQCLGFVLAMHAGSMLMRVIGGAPITALWVFVPQIWRDLLVLFFSSAASFTLALLSDSVIAGVLVGLYLALAMAGRAFLAKLYNPSPIQNASAYFTFGVMLLCIAMLFFARKRRGSAAPSPWLATAGLAFFGLTVWNFFVIIRDGHDSHTRQNPALELMASQDSDVGKLAGGFSLPDQSGKLTSISQYPGKVLVLALWQPDDPNSGLLLQTLNEIQSKYSAKGMQVLTICLSDDNSAAPTIAYGDRLNYPVVTDWGTTSVPEKLLLSPMAAAYRTTLLPAVIVTDRRRRDVQILRGASAYDGKSLTEIVDRQLAAEPR